MTRLSTLAAVAALALAQPAAAQGAKGGFEQPSHGYGYGYGYGGPRYHAPPPRHWGPPPGYGHYAPRPHVYYPPPRVYYPPPRFYYPPPPPPGVGLYFRF